MSDPVLTAEQLLGVLAERDRVIEELQARIVELERRLGAELEGLLPCALG